MAITGEQFVNAKRLLMVGIYLFLVSSVSGDSKVEQAQVPFRRPGMNIGGGGSLEDVKIGAADDKMVNTCAITMAVSALPAGFREVPPANGLEAKEHYKTDYAQISPSALTEYNQKNGDLQLPAGPIYGVVYEVSYDIQTGHILYEVKSKLSYKGSSSRDWYEYAKTYNDAFFSRKLLDGIVERVRTCAKPN